MNATMTETPTRRGLSRRVGCYNPPKTDRPYVQFDAAVERAKLVRHTLGVLSIGDHVRLRTVAHQGRIAAEYALAKVVPNGSARMASLLLKPRKKWTAEESHFAERFVDSPEFTPLHSLEVSCRFQTPEGVRSERLDVILPQHIEYIQRREG